MIDTPVPDKKATVIAPLSPEDRSRGIDRLKRQLELFLQTGNRQFIEQALAIIDCLQENPDA